MTSRCCSLLCVTALCVAAMSVAAMDALAAVPPRDEPRWIAAETRDGPRRADGIAAWTVHTPAYRTSHTAGRVRHLPQVIVQRGPRDHWLAPPTETGRWIIAAIEDVVTERAGIQKTPAGKAPDGKDTDEKDTAGGDR